MTIPPVSSASSTPEQVRQLFNPRSVALIGATDKSRWSWSIFGNLQQHGFAGPVYLVNPRGIPVHGHDTYARIADLPAPVDLAFVMVPTSAVLPVLAEVADHGIPSVVLLTSGFAEIGEEGAELERQVVELARRRGLTILGPNGNGYINAAAGITPYGLADRPPAAAGPGRRGAAERGARQRGADLRPVAQRRRQPPGVHGQRVDGVDDRRHAVPHR